jgi:hypothetical protein
VTPRYGVSVQCLAFRALLVALNSRDANTPAQHRSQTSVGWPSSSAAPATSGSCCLRRITPANSNRSRHKDANNRPARSHKSPAIETSRVVQHNPLRSRQ